MIALSREGSGRHGDETRSEAVLLYLLLNKNVESFDTSILLSIFDDIKKSLCSEIAVQRGWLCSSNKEKHSG